MASEPTMHVDEGMEATQRVSTRFVGSWLDFVNFFSLQICFFEGARAFVRAVPTGGRCQTNDLLRLPQGHLKPSRGARTHHI